MRAADEWHCGRRGKAKDRNRKRRRWLCGAGGLSDLLDEVVQILGQLRGEAGNLHEKSTSSSSGQTNPSALTPVGK
jgi:hypothetical protein